MTQKVKKRTERHYDGRFGWLLRYDNVTAHDAQIIHFLAKKQMVKWGHPPNSPDVASCDFCPFPIMKIAIKGRSKACGQNTEELSVRQVPQKF